MKRSGFQFLLFVMFLSGVVLAENFISAGNPGFEYHGRFDMTNKNEVSFDWPGVYITCAFDGTSCRAVLKGKNIFDINIDGREVKTIEINAEKDTFLLADGLKKCRHELRIVKRTESNDRISTFYGIIIDDKAEISKSAVKYSHRIEFIGDSYTAGFGNVHPVRECLPDKCDSLMYSTTNTAKSFGALIASRFNSDYQINAISGKGLIRNYNGMDNGKEFLFCYERTLQSGINNTQISSAHYDLTLWHPEVIVIGIGINDFQADPPYSDTVKFDSAYTQFIKMLQTKHPGVLIICCATQVWPTKALIPRVKSIVEKINAPGKKNVFYYEFQTENTALFGHPSIKDHELIAKDLGVLIGTVTGWK